MSLKVKTDPEFDMNKFLAGAMKFICCLALVPFGMWVDAKIFSSFWGWFLVPIMPSLAPISMVQGLGLSLAIWAFWGRGLPDERRDGYSALQVMIGKLFLKLIIFWEGWAIYHFIICST